ncbi:MAG TPA: DUF4118 domain-containing protein, partial [Novosphingobium sp.]|nr:DUF4118 domain-containing protein [Novosphingobium sp.]
MALWRGMDGLALRPWALARAVGLLLGISAMGYAGRAWMGEGYAALIFVLGVTLIGAVDGQLVALVSAVLGALLFDFFLSEPLFQISLANGRDWLVPVTLTLTALLAGGLSGRLKDQTRRALHSNRQLQSLLEASRALQPAASEADVLDALVRTAEPGVRVGLYRKEGGGVTPVAGSPPGGDWLSLAQALLQSAAGEMNGLPPSADSEGVLGCRLAGSDSQAAPWALLMTDSAANRADRALVAALG